MSLPQPTGLGCCCRPFWRELFPCVLRTFQQVHPTMHRPLMNSLLCLSAALLLGAPVVASAQEEKTAIPPGGLPMRDRVPLQLRDKDGSPRLRPNPSMPLKATTPQNGPTPFRSGGITPPKGLPSGPKGGTRAGDINPPGSPVVTPAPAVTPPLPGATSIMGGGKTRVDVTQVDAPPGGPGSGNGRTAADVDEKRRRDSGKALFNFENAQLIDIVKQISKLTGKNFILRENLKGQKLTILCEEPVTAKDAYRAFLVALEINNLAVVPAGRFLKIEERKNSIRQTIPTYFDNDADLPGDESMVTYIHQLQYVDMDQAQKLVDSMLNKSVGDMQVYQPNLLILSDSAVNISRIRKLLEKIDVPGYQSRIRILDIKYAPAADIANKLTALFDPNKAAQKKTPVGKQAKGPNDKDQDANLDDYYVTKILADERTNKLIIVGTEDSFKRVKELVTLLDVPEGPNNAPQVHVHNLENADSEKLTTALNNLAQAGKKGGDKKKGPQAADTGMFEGDIKVTADPATNSLVIVASNRDYMNLARVIRRLDVRRPQVFVEAVIMEVTLNRSTELGLDWFTAYAAPAPGMGSGGGIIAPPGGQARAAKAIAGDATAFLGFLAFAGPTTKLQLGGKTYDMPTFGAVLNALEQDGNVDVLSTPHILTTDNVKAEILVGQTVPFASGFTSNLGGGAINSFMPIVSVQRQDVALKFVVTPHVNTSNFVRLELDQEVSDLGERVTVAPGQEQRATTKRTAKTTVVVKDEQTVIIGGLISDKKSHSEQKVPILGDVPWLGFLFRSPKDEVVKTNLMIVLTPHIIRSDEDFRRIYERKLKERQEFMETFYGVNTPVLGPVDFERKVGAFGSLHQRLRDEMLKVENGGPGAPGESIIGPEQLGPEPSRTGKEGDGMPEGDEAAKGRTEENPDVRQPGREGESPQPVPPQSAAPQPISPSPYPIQPFVPQPAPGAPAQVVPPPAPSME